jgi:hypothetical protein
MLVRERRNDLVSEARIFLVFTNSGPFLFSQIVQFQKLESQEPGSIQF